MSAAMRASCLVRPAVKIPVPGAKITRGKESSLVTAVASGVLVYPYRSRDTSAKDFAAVTAFYEGGIVDGPMVALSARVGDTTVVHSREVKIQAQPGSRFCHPIRPARFAPPSRAIHEIRNVIAKLFRQSRVFGFKPLTELDPLRIGE